MPDPNLNISYGQSAKEDPYRILLSKEYKFVCSLCDSKVEKFLLKSWDGTSSLYFRCLNSRCMYFGEESKFKHVYLSGPMGSTKGLTQSAKFTIIESRRTPAKPRPRHSTERRVLNRNQNFTPTEDNIPKLGNKPDYELESMVRGRPAIILSLADDPVNDDEPINNDDRYSD